MDTETAIATPLQPQVLRFIDAYCACRDVKKAAIEAGFASKEGAGLYRRPAVHEEITRRMGAIDAEVGKIIAKKRVVNVEALDHELMQVVKIPRKVLLETPSLATPKVNAIEMGYKRIGLLIDDNFVPDASSGPQAEQAPRIYRPAEQTIITHQITETRQVVTQRGGQPYSPQVPQAAVKNPPTIDAEVANDPWANF
jgi:hypothetical protein